MTGGTPLEMIESVAHGEILLPNLISLSFLEKNKDQNLQVSEMFLIFALTFY